MFGYIKPYVPELKVKNHELYRAVYCGLCKSTGKVASHLTRVSLSYDIVFLALFRLALAEEKYEIKPERCMAHPMKKRPVMQNNAQLEYCAGVSALLNYYNLKDKIKDKGFFDKLCAYLALPFAYRAKKRVTGLCDVEEAIIKSLNALDKIECEGHPSPDEAAQCFGELTSYILSRGMEEKTRIAAAAGLSVGRFIYLADAADDYEDDKKKGNYNPFVAAGTDPKEYGEQIKHDLLLQAHGTYQAALLAGVDDGICDILENIAQYGMIDVAYKILKISDEDVRQADEE